MKIKLVILLILISSSLSYPQIINSIGFKTGVSLSKQYWEYSSFTYTQNFNILTGKAGFITADFINKEYWEIMVDVGFYQSKNTTSYNPYVAYISTSEPPLYNLNFCFFTFSPSFKLKIPAKAFTPYIFIGPRIDYYSNKYTNNSYFYKEVPDIIHPETGFGDMITKKPILGLNIGEGICYRIKRFSVLAEYKFQYSFSYIIDNPPLFHPVYFSRDRVKTNAHIITIGLKYNFINN